VFGIFKKAQAAATPDFALASDRIQSSPDCWQRIGATASSVDDEILSGRLAQAVAWCDSLTSVADLRSEALRPRLFHDGPDDLVRDLGHNRCLQLRYKKMPVRIESPVVATGRFMLYFPDENLSDGYAEMVSGGFFDVNNLPACDTWVSFFSEEGYPRPSARRYLLCYVPKPLMDAADAGIEGNPESCIAWLDQSDVSIRRRVETLARVAPRRTDWP
jgi:hypothetical protein